MTYLDQHTQDQIADLVEACARYWELRGVALERCHEMRLELEEHFVQAALDGKALEAVIGPNPPAFAEAWAREMRPQMIRGGRVIILSLVYAFSIVGTSALAQQWFTHTPSFSLTMLTVYLLVSCGLLALLMPLEGFLASRIRTRQGRGMLLMTVVLLVTLVFREAGLRVNWSMALLNWSWPVTMLLLALAVILFSLQIWWATRQRPIVIEAVGAPLMRSILLFVARVAAFDVLLFIASIAVFHVCFLAGRLL